MKKIFLAIIFLSSLSSFAQCINCNSLDKALVNPKIVKSLEINAIAHKISFDSFPTKIFLLVNLEKLFLSDMSINEIPGEIGRLKKLKSIGFVHCNLTSIPNELFDLKELKQVNLLTNKFPDEKLKDWKMKFKKFLPNAVVLISKQYYDITL